MVGYVWNMILIVTLGKNAGKTFVKLFRWQGSSGTTCGRLHASYCPLDKSWTKPLTGWDLQLMCILYAFLKAEIELIDCFLMLLQDLPFRAGFKELGKVSPRIANILRWTISPIHRAIVSVLRPENDSDVGRLKCEYWMVGFIRELKMKQKMKPIVIMILILNDIDTFT